MIYITSWWNQATLHSLSKGAKFRFDQRSRMPRRQTATESALDSGLSSAASRLLGTADPYYNESHETGALLRLRRLVCDP